MLLMKDPKKRIRHDKIPNHSFFKKINFEEIVTLAAKPPFRPKTVYYFNLEKY
jgi:hypothetical protein